MASDASDASDSSDRSNEGARETSGVPARRRFAGRLRRTRRQWLTDALVALGGLGLGLLLLAATASDDPAVRDEVGRQIVGGVIGAAGVLVFRRSHPLALALVCTPLGFVMVAITGSTVVALFAVAVARRARMAVSAAGFHMVLCLVLFAVDDFEWGSYLPGVVTFLFLDAVVVTSGMLVRSHRALISSLEERARQAENEQRMRVDEARHLERERIAREMHDVLAHRISLLAVHAGALEFRAAATPDEARAAGVIRQCAHDALEDLRDVIRMLRTDSPAPDADATPDTDADRPQPTLADLPALVEQSRRTGADVEFVYAEAPAPDDDVPARLGRHAYRIVQEGLTNARKHAPGEPVRVRVDATGTTGLRVEVVNGLRAGRGPHPVLPGAGAGLIGLRERVTLVGGRLEHGPEDGEFRLRAWLPWTP